MAGDPLPPPQDPPPPPPPPGDPKADPVPIPTFDKTNILVKRDPVNGCIKVTGTTFDGVRVSQELNLTKNCMKIYRPKTQNFYIIPLPELEEGDQFVDLYINVTIG